MAVRLDIGRRMDEEQVLADMGQYLDYHEMYNLKETICTICTHSHNLLVLLLLKLVLLAYAK